MTKSNWIKVSVLVVLLSLAIIYGIYNPAHSGLFPKCPFYMITGYKCPGCGSQRAIHYLINLDIGKAFAYNAFLICSIPIIIILFFCQTYQNRYKNIYNILFGKYSIMIISFAIIAWWIVRNVYDL